MQEGFGLLTLKDTAKGVRQLERAAALHPANAPLHAFLGEHFFEAGKNALALDYLERAVAEDLIEKAHQVCPYSNATRGNVDVRLTLA